ncbi:MAG: thioredoxin family protein [Pirellulales bacterium]
MTLRFGLFATLLLFATLGCGPAATTGEPARTLQAATAPNPVAIPAPAKAAVAAPAAGIVFQTDYKAALAQARTEGKPLLLFFGAEWCTHTQRMASELPADPLVAKLSADFICVRLDGEAVPKLCEDYRVRAYPTLVITAPGGVVLQRLTGLQASGAVAQEMSAALTAVADRFPTGTTTLQR